MTLLRNVSSPGAPTSGAAVAARAIGATKTYGKGDGAVRALDQVDVEFAAGAFTASTSILTDTMGKTFDGLFEDANQGVDDVVRRAAAVEGSFVEVRERVDTATLDQMPPAASKPPPVRSRARPPWSAPTARPRRLPASV